MRHLLSRLLHCRHLNFFQNVNFLLNDNLIGSALLRDVPFVPLRNSLLRNLSSLADERSGLSLDELLVEMASKEPPKWFMDKYTCPNLEDTLRDKDIVETISLSDESCSRPLGVESTANCVELRHIPTKAIVKVQDFRVLELNRTLARQLLAEKVDLITKGADSVIHQYNERRKLMEQQEKQARVKLHENRMRRKNDWNSGFGKKFQRDRSFGNDDRGRRDGYNNSDNFQKKSKTSRVDDWLDDF